MLKAFSFSENNPNDIPADNAVAQEEKQILIAQAMEIHQREFEEERKDCPICSRKGVFIFRKYDRDYFQCTDCKSIYQITSVDEIRQYAAMKTLEAFRHTEKYQSAAVEQRSGQWTELLEWLKYRTYRYLGTNKGLCVFDYDNYFDGFREIIEKDSFCSKYVAASVHEEESAECKESADLALYMACIQQTIEPVNDLKRVNKVLKKGGLVFLSSRLGTGFDILTLRGHAERIFPYSHTLLPSIKGIEQCLEKAGFRILETITPGNFDVTRVKANRNHIHKQDFFIRFMFGDDSDVNLEEFQRFLQKNRLSSYAQVIAEKL